MHNYEHHPHHSPLLAAGDIRHLVLLLCKKQPLTPQLSPSSRQSIRAHRDSHTPSTPDPFKHHPSSQTHTCHCRFTGLQRFPSASYPVPVPLP